MLKTKTLAMIAGGALVGAFLLYQAGLWIGENRGETKQIAKQNEANQEARSEIRERVKDAISDIGNADSDAVDRRLRELAGHRGSADDGDMCGDARSASGPC